MQYTMTQGQRGVALIEVLVAILLLTIGLLAMAGLTLSATTQSKLSQIRGVASVLANDYAERARANLAGFDAGKYEVAAGAVAEDEDPCPEVQNLSAAAACVAEIDQARWLKEVAQRLPAGKALVKTEDLPASGTSGLRSMDVYIAWMEQDLDADKNSLGENFFATEAYRTGECKPVIDDIGENYRCVYFRVAI